MDLSALILGFFLGLFAMQRRPDLWPNLLLTWPPPVPDNHCGKAANKRQ
jgi:hypothetical protein